MDYFYVKQRPFWVYFDSNKSLLNLLHHFSIFVILAHEMFTDSSGMLCIWMGYTIMSRIDWVNAVFSPEQGNQEYRGVVLRWEGKRFHRKLSGNIFTWGGGCMYQAARGSIEAGTIQTLKDTWTGAWIATVYRQTRVRWGTLISMEVFPYCIF